MEEKKLLKKKERVIADGNQEQLAGVYSDLGDYFYQHGRYEDAIVEYQQEAKIRNKLGQRLEMAKAHRMLAEIYMLVSEFDNALKHVNIYLKNVQMLGNKVEEQRAYATLGRVHLLHGQSFSDSSSTMKPLKNAEKAFIKSLLICKELSGNINKIEVLDMQARLYLNIGVVKEHMEDFEEAITYLEKAIKVAKANDIYELLHLCYISASLLYHYKKNDYTLALRFCNLAIEVAQRLPNKEKKECETLITKSEIMIKIGDFQSAKKVLHKAYKLKTPDLNDSQTIEKTLRIVAALCYTLDSLVIISSTDYRGKKELYEKMGDGCCLLQNYTKAIDYYLKMLECVEMCRDSDKELIPVYVSLYQTYKDNKQYDHATEYLWKELELNKNEPTEAFNTLCNIGEIYELQLKPFWTIQEIYQKAIDEAKKAGKERLEKIALTRLIKLQEKFKMHTLLEELKDEIVKRGFDLNNIEEDSESEITSSSEQNTPDIGEDICLDDLTDSEAELEETEKPRLRKRGTCLTIKRNNKGETQLHQACISGNLTLARRLIDQGHAVNIRDHAGWLPLHEACNHGFRDIVELLLDRGAASAINDKGGTSCDGITPLYDACSNGYLDVVELLLDRGANSTLRTDFGDTTLSVLDKWRNTVELDTFEQAQYEKIRSILSHQLSKAGILDKSLTAQSPITNESCSKNNSETCTATLEMLAFQKESSDSDEELCCSKSSNKSLNRSNRSRRSFSNDEEIERSSRSVSILREPNLSRDNTNAKAEYRHVMESLKHPNRILSESDLGEPLSKRKSALLQPGEVGDDWLEYDLGPNKKKRKYLTDREIYGESERVNGRCQASPSKENLMSLLNDNSQDAFQIMLESGNKQSTAKSKPASASRRSFKRQSSLLDSGFCRFRSELSLPSEDSNDDKLAEPDSTTPIAINRETEEFQNTPSAQVVSVVSFKIRVEDELLLVPVERKKVAEVNIQWLAEEASRRYYNLVGLKPVIRLMTSDGFAFEETDAISVALEQSMISSKVLEWKISPLAQRYEEMCTQLHIDRDGQVKAHLEKAQVSNTVSFNELFLTPELTEPIFKALLHQTNLRVLDLSNNFIQNEGIKQLSKSLNTLKQLRLLNLEGNCISTEGLELVASSLSATDGSMELEEVCLNFNPLGNQSIRALEKICNKLPNLRKLHLASCNITDFYNFNLNFHDLTHFNISFNKLTSECLKTLLRKLNSCRLQELNISFTIQEKSLGDGINEFFESGTCEKFRKVELAGCQLFDSNVYNIVGHLSKAQDLRVLNLAENPKLTTLSLQYVLEHIPQVKQILMQQCMQVITCNNFGKLNITFGDKAPELISVTVVNDDIAAMDDLKAFWEQRYGDRGKIDYCDKNVTLYINDCDLASV